MLAEQGQKQPEFRVNHVISTWTDLTNGLYWAVRHRSKTSQENY